MTTSSPTRLVNRRPAPVSESSEAEEPSIGNRMNAYVQHVEKPSRGEIWACGEEAAVEAKLFEAERDRAEGDLRGAGKKFQDLLETMGKSRLTADVLLMAQAATGLALTAHDQCNWEAAAPSYEQAITFYEQTRLAMHWQSIARLRNNLAIVYRELNRGFDAETCYNKAIALYEEAVADKPNADLASLYGNLAFLHFDRGAFGDALSKQAKALELTKASTRPDDNEALFTAERRAGIFAYFAGMTSQAQKHFTAARAILSEAGETSTPAYAELLVNQGAAMLQNGELKAARDVYCDAALLLQEQRGDEDLFLAAVLNNVGCIHLQMRETASALDFFNHALYIQKVSPVVNEVGKAEVYHNLALAYTEAGNAKLAAVYRSQAMDLFEDLSIECREKLVIASKTGECVTSATASTPAIERPELQTFASVPSSSSLRLRDGRLSLPMKTETIDWEF